MWTCKGLFSQYISVPLRLRRPSLAAQNTMTTLWVKETGRVHAVAACYTRRSRSQTQLVTHASKLSIRLSASRLKSSSPVFGAKFGGCAQSLFWSYQETQQTHHWSFIMKKLRRWGSHLKQTVTDGCHAWIKTAFVKWVLLMRFRVANYFFSFLQKHNYAFFNLKKEFH